MLPKPILSVVAGPPGAGKSTVIASVRGEVELPTRHAIEHNLSGQELSETLQDALRNQQSLLIESRLDSPAVLHAMDRALERGFSVELVLVDVDAVELLMSRLGSGHTNDELSEALARYRHHVPSAVDMAKRVLLIDNSAAQPIVQELPLVKAANAGITGPRWFADKVVAPQLERLASREALRRFTVKGPLQAIIQAARASNRPSEGLVVAVTKHHALQRVGQALHLIHDLAMFPMGSLSLIVGAVAVMAYQADRASALEREGERRQFEPKTEGRSEREKELLRERAR